MMLDTTSASGILKEAFFIQLPFWFLVLSNLGPWIKNQFEGRDWFAAIEKQKGGTSEWILFATACPQHTLAGCLLTLSFLTGNTSWFVHGIISEWAYESIDVVNQTLQYTSGAFNDNEDGKKAYIAMVCHHVPGIITILPATIYFQDVPEFRLVVWSLLGYAWVMVVGYLLGRTYKLDDLGERTRYTVLFVMNFAVVVYCRVYLFPTSMYALARAYWSKVSWIFVLLGLMYAVLMTGFNMIMIVVNLERLYKLSFAKSEKEKICAGQSLQRKTSNFMRLGFDVLDESDDDQVSARTMRRAKTTPVFVERKHDD